MIITIIIYLFLYFYISLISTFLAQGVEISAQPQLFWSRRSSKESFSPLSLFLPPSFLPPPPFLPLFPPSSLSSANLICRHRNRKKASCGLQNQLRADCSPHSADCGFPSRCSRPAPPRVPTELVIDVASRCSCASAFVGGEKHGGGCGGRSGWTHRRFGRQQEGGNGRAAEGAPPCAPPLALRALLAMLRSKLTHRTVCRHCSALPCRRRPTTV